MLVVVRLWLPDRPGALGQVASRIGAVRGDVMGIEILEAGGERVIDELLVELADPSLVDLLTAEIAAVDGVSVEHVRPVEADRVNQDLIALAVGAELAECDPLRRAATLCAGLLRVADAEWSVVVRGGMVEAQDGQLPQGEWMAAFLTGCAPLGNSAEGALDRYLERAPSDVLWGMLPRSDAAIAAGRSDRPVHSRERLRVDLLARLADAVGI